ncbi:MAG TPA: acyltransferase family protein [Opitutus sp.]|nr:acyltransferase family protein [Opitutus sp.]
MNRLAWVDHLKAFGIVIVAFGHVRIPLPVEYWVHSFVIPLFLFLAGYLISPESFTASPRVYFRRKMLRLVAAYVIFGFIGALHYVLMSQAGVERSPLPATVMVKLQSVFYASGTFPNENALQLYPVALWFFPTIIVALGLAFWILRAPAGVVPLLIGGSLLLSWSWRNLVLPWELESALTAVPYIVAGQLFRRSPGWQARAFALPRFWAPLLLALGWMLAMLNGRVDFRLSILNDPVLFHLAAWPTLLGLLITASAVPASKLSRRLSAATIFIFPTHQLLYWFFDTLSREGLHLPEAFMHSYAYAILEASCALMLLAWSYGWVQQRVSARRRRDRPPAGVTDQSFPAILP